MCSCGQWFRVSQPLPPELTGSKPENYVEGIGDRWLNMWGGACGFLAGSTAPHKGGLIAVALFCAGYLVSTGIVSFMYRRGTKLRSGHRFALAVAYLLAALVLMVIVPLLA